MDVVSSVVDSYNKDALHFVVHGRMSYDHSYINYLAPSFVDAM